MASTALVKIHTKLTAGIMGLKAVDELDRAKVGLYTNTFHLDLNIKIPRQCITLVPPYATSAR